MLGSATLALCGVPSNRVNYTLKALPNRLPALVNSLLCECGTSRYQSDFFPNEGRVRRRTGTPWELRIFISAMDAGWDHSRRAEANLL